MAISLNYKYAIQKIVNLKPGRLWDEKRFSNPSELKSPKSEIGSWYLASIPSIDSNPFQVMIHSVKGGLIRVTWPDKFSGIHCYPYTLDYSTDSILIEKDSKDIRRASSYLKKHGIKHSISGNQISAGRFQIAIEQDSIVLSREGSVVSILPLSPSGMESAISIMRKHPRHRVQEDPSEIDEDFDEVLGVTARTKF